MYGGVCCRCDGGMRAGPLFAVTILVCMDGCVSLHISIGLLAVISPSSKRTYVWWCMYGGGVASVVSTVGVWCMYGGGGGVASVVVVPPASVRVVVYVVTSVVVVPSSKCRCGGVCCRISGGGTLQQAYVW